MPTKSYTLADGSTVTVTSTANGVPFNEGMQALTKAIKARVAVRDGSGTGGASGKLVPNLRLDYNGPTDGFSRSSSERNATITAVTDSDATEFYWSVKSRRNGSGSMSGNFAVNITVDDSDNNKLDLSLVSAYDANISGVVSVSCYVPETDNYQATVGTYSVQWIDW